MTNIEITLLAQAEYVLRNYLDAEQEGVAGKPVSTTKVEDTPQSFIRGLQTGKLLPNTGPLTL